MKHNKSFTLIEVIIAVFILTVGVSGAFALVQRTIAFSSVVSDQLAASYLAQEGIEVARNVRDSNWLEQRSNPDVLWNDGLIGRLVPPLPPCDFYGDVNIDGVVSQADVDLVRQFLVGIAQLDEIQRKRADVKNDGLITSADSMMIGQYVAGTRDTFPVCDVAKFQRTITILEAADNSLDISVEITWQERGRTHQVTAETELHNWK